MSMKKQYSGLDVVKVTMALLVAARHMVQVFYAADSPWQRIIISWLSNLAVPVFFIIASFFLFRKIDESSDPRNRTVVFRYCKRLLSLYLIWCILYIPVTRCDWPALGQSTGERILTYVQLLLFSSPIVQLWYLHALAAACLLIWFCYSRGVKIRYLLIASGILFILGCLGDNWFFNQRLPMPVQQLLRVYTRYFLTMRNGIFYGSFFVCIGLWFAKSEWRLPFWAAAAGTVASLGLMYLETGHCFNTNMVFTSAPAAFCLFSAALSVNWKERKLYPRLRGMSEWIYLSHFYFFYILSWTSRWNPFPFTERNTAIMALGLTVLFSVCMVFLAEQKRFSWLKRMI